MSVNNLPRMLLYCESEDIDTFGNLFEKCFGIGTDFTLHMTGNKGFKLFNLINFKL